MKQKIKRITAWIMAFLSVVTSLCSNGVIKVFAASRIWRFGMLQYAIQAL